MKEKNPHKISAKSKARYNYYENNNNMKKKNFKRVKVFIFGLSSKQSFPFHSCQLSNIKLYWQLFDYYNFQLNNFKYGKIGWL